MVGMNPRYHRQTMPKRKRMHFVVIALVFCFAATGIANLVKPFPVIAAAKADITTSPNTATNLTWPTRGEAAIGAQGFGLLDTHGPETPLPTASIAKVITALALLEQKPLSLGQKGPSLTIGAGDVALYQKYAAIDGSLIPVTIGEDLTEYQILQALMLPSANNIADSAAIWAFGSLPSYTEYANQMLKRMGVTHTTVADDASGFLPQTVSTPSDLVKIGLAAMQNPVLVQVVSQPQANLPVAGTVNNVNVLLNRNGIVGIKTGNTDQAGGCFLFAANYAPVSNHPVTIVGAVMGAADLGEALQSSLTLLESAKHNFTVQTFVHAGQTVASYNVPWAGTVHAVSPEDVATTVWNGKTISPTIAVDNIKKPIAKNNQVGTVTVLAGSNKMTSKLVLEKPINQPSVFWRLFRNPF